MQSKLDHFVNAAFKLDNKIYNVLEVSVKSLKASIKTDRRTFVLYESELDDLIEKIVFCEVSEQVGSAAVMAQPMFKNNALTQQVIEHNGLSNRMSKKLEEVFDELTSNPGEETYKKAKSMVEVANSIVNVQMANYKYLTLNN